MSRFVFLLFQVAPRPPGPFHLRGSNCYKSQDMIIFYISRIPERILFLDLRKFLVSHLLSSLFIYVLRFLGCRVAIGEVASSAANFTVEILMCFATCSETHRSEPMKNPRENNVSIPTDQGMCYEANGSANDFARSSSLKQAYHCSIYLPMFV